MDAHPATAIAHLGLARRTLSATLRSEVRRVYDVGRKEHRGLALEFEAFAGGALRSICSRLERSVGTCSDSDVEHALRTAAAADLYLARGCEDGREAAWERLHEVLLPRLRGLARHRGADAGEAERVAGEVLADLALPPPGGRARTLMGTFAGRGSLFGWLAVILVRRMASDARHRRPRPLDPQAIEEQAGGGRAAHTATEDPEVATQARETTAIFQTALRQAWDRLTQRERLTLILKYRDGYRQRVIARILGVGEPRVSRLVRQSLAKLSEAARGLQAGDGAWPALMKALEDEMTRQEGVTTPPLQTESDGESRDGES